MKMNNVNEVKLWLRSIPLLKKELRLKAEFYGGLAADISRLTGGKQSAAVYRDKMDELYSRMEALTEEVDRLFSLLSEEERLIMTAKYLKLIKWDYIELHTYYSRRQAIRIHNKALQKLVGQEVGERAI